MAQKKTANKSKSKRDKVVKKKSNGPVLLVVGLVAVAAIAGIFVISGGAGKNRALSEAEKKYFGRFLPAGYEAPKLLDKVEYTSTVNMAQVAATTTDKGITLKASDVINNKIVYFEWQKPGAPPVSMMAFLKPSGKLFAGVSFCPPCQGKYQRIEGDLTLTCEACGTKRDLETQVGISGACKLYPVDEMPAKVVGDNIEIEKADLDRYSPQPLDRPIGG
ncbi:MAG: Fe-S-containing protein [Candidatus Aquicultorales bacterium]